MSTKVWLGRNAAHRLEIVGEEVMSQYAPTLQAAYFTQIEVSAGTVARWRRAIEAYAMAQAEMEAAMTARPAIIKRA